MLSGLVYVVLYLPFLVVPELAQKGIRAFPRNIWAGGLLAAVALAWAAWELNDIPLGVVDGYKSWLWVLGPVVYGLVMLFMNELLAPRALGGLLMLAASPILEAQRVNDSAWTVVPAVLCYVGVVVGMVLVLSPYRFRQAAQLCCATKGACRLTGLVGVAAGAGVAVMGMLVF